MCSRASGLFCACLLFSCVVHHCQCSDEQSHHHHLDNENDSQNSIEKSNNHLFVHKLFQIFGHNGVLNHKEFEIMIQSLGITLNASFDLFPSKKCPYLSVTHPVSEIIKESQNTSNQPSKLLREDIASTEKSSDAIVDAKSVTTEVEISGFNKNFTIDGSQCFTTHELLRAHNLSLQDDVLTPSDFYRLCPALIYHITHESCAKENSHQFSSDIQYEEESVLKVWLYTALSVVTISMCGLVSVAFIPLIQRLCYQSFLQFLVALAVGSLSGDALLHLLPHAMTPAPEGHHHDDENDEGHNSIVIWRGFTALLGIYLFFITERLLNNITRFRKMKQNAKVLQMPKFARSLTNVDGEQSRMVGEKLSHHKHGSYGYKFDPANAESLEGLDGGDSILEEKKQITTADNSVDQSKSQSDIDSERSEAKDTDNSNEKPTSSPMKPLRVDVTYLPPEKQQESETPNEEFHRETVVYRQHNHDHSYVVTLTDHNNHAAHSHHHHGHSHELPDTVSSVAWMVVLGDGLHNFCDGLAIGAAFSSGIAGGISTSIAVLCHELPHELGDFAMLLKSGMSVKQAVLYNSVSSVLCFIGSIIGVFLGNIPTVTNYIFAAAGGMFLYIALVDMLPELSSVSEHSITESCQNLLLQSFGVTIGTSIMLLIAIYEHDLHHLVS